MMLRRVVGTPVGRQRAGVNGVGGAYTLPLAVLAVVGVCAALGVLVAASRARSAQAPRATAVSSPCPGLPAKLNFGSAPDSAPSRYSNGVIAHFPTLVRDDGARAHPGVLWLGAFERTGCDAVLYGEAGVDGVAFQSLQPCRVMKLRVTVHLAHPAVRSGYVYLNLWSDWNRDGRWGGSVLCHRTQVPEHAVRDLPLLVRKGALITNYQIDVLPGPGASPFWSRAILSATPLGLDAPSGDVGDGEVEDYMWPAVLSNGVGCGNGGLGVGQKGFAPFLVSHSILPLTFTRVVSSDLPFWTAKRTYLGPNAPRPAAVFPGAPPNFGLIEYDSLPGDIPGPAIARIDVVVGYVVNNASPKKKRLFTCKFLVTRKANPGVHYKVPLPTASGFLVSPLPNLLLRLQVTVTGTMGGSGMVTSDYGGLNCPVVCTAWVPQHHRVTLTATAAAGSTFAGWSGACAGTKPTCVLPMASPESVTATFTGSRSAPSYRCVGQEFKLFDNSNTGAADNGATEPSFSTKGQTYCLIEIDTYHWNVGRGDPPGTIALASAQGTLGPWPASATSGAGGAPNVNWMVFPGSPAQPVIIDGTYACDDSHPATWSWNPMTGGKGFCTVYVEAAHPAG